MTKKELEKEAEEKYGEVDREFIACQDEGEVFNIGYVLGAEPREKRIEELEAQIEQFQKIYDRQKGTLKKLRIALIQERTANIMNYGKGGVDMFDSMLEVLKDVSN